MASVALGLLNIVASRLVFCMQKYDELTKVVKRLENTLGSVEKLLNDRAKEARLKGRIQDDLTRTLKGLNDVIDEILEVKANGGAKKLFCGSCMGGGAAKYVNDLQEQDHLLRDLLTLADSEANVVQASALEEMAGGAAGKHIMHTGAREFWRGQFQNELSLTIDRFFEGIYKWEGDFKLAFRDREADVTASIRNRLDQNLDETLTVAEFNTFVEKSRSAALPGSSMYEVVVGAAFQGTLREALVGPHSSKVTAFTSIDSMAATGDCDGVVKTWNFALSGMSRQTCCIIGASDVPVVCLEFVEETGQPLRLFAATDSIMILNPYSGERLMVLKSPHKSVIRDMSVKGRYMATVAAWPSAGVSIWRQEARDQKFEFYAQTGFQSFSYQFAKILSDETHACFLMIGNKAQVFNFRVGVAKAYIGRNNMPRPVAIAVQGNKVFMSYPNESSREVYEISSEGTESSCTTEDLIAPEAARTTFGQYREGDMSAELQIRVGTDGFIKFGKADGEAHKSAVPKGATINVVRAAVKGTRMFAAWEMGGVHGTAIFTTNGSTPNPPLITTSKVINLEHYLAVVSPGMNIQLHRTNVTCVIKDFGKKTAGTTGVNRHAAAFLTSNRNSHVHVWTSDHKLVARINTRALPDFLTNVSCLASDGDEFFVAGVNGALLKFRVPEKHPALKDMPEGEESAASWLHEDTTVDERMTARRRLLKWELEAFKATCTSKVNDAPKGYWNLTANPHPGIAVFELLQRLTPTAREMCGSLVEFFFHHRPGAMSFQKKQLLLDAIAALDAEAEPPIGRDTARDMNRGCVANALAHPDTWAPVARRRLIFGSHQCPLCDKKYETQAELDWQVCNACAAKRPDPKLCIRCAAAPTEKGLALCVTCMSDMECRNFLLPICIVAVSSEMLLVGATQCYDMHRGGGEGSMLIQLRRDNLEEVCRVKNAYIKGTENLVVTDAFAPLFGHPIVMAPISTTGVCLFGTSAKLPLDNQVVGVITVDAPAFNMALDGNAPKLETTDDGLQKITVALVCNFPTKGEIASYHVTAEQQSKGPSKISSTPFRKFEKTIFLEAHAILPFPGGILAGFRTGSLLWVTETPSKTYKVAGIMVTHNECIVSRVMEHPVTGDVLSFGADATMGVWPAALLNQQERSSNNDPKARWVVELPAKLSQKGDSNKPFMYIGDDFEWRGSEGGSWAALTVGVNEATAALNQGPVLLRTTKDKLGQVITVSKASNDQLSAVTQHHVKLEKVYAVTRFVAPNVASQGSSTELRAGGPPLKITFAALAQNTTVTQAPRADGAFPSSLFLGLMFVAGKATLQVFAETSGSNTGEIDEPLGEAAVEGGMTTAWIPINISRFPDDGIINVRLKDAPSSVVVAVMLAHAHIPNGMSPAIFVPAPAAATLDAPASDAAQKPSAVSQRALWNLPFRCT